VVTVIVTPDALKQADRVPRIVQGRILRIVERLSA
jgi:hypothetical protein